MRGEEAVARPVLLWEAEDGQVCGVGQIRETVGLSRRWDGSVVCCCQVEGDEAKSG